jgi:hypothetical protein
MQQDWHFFKRCDRVPINKTTTTYQNPLAGYLFKALKTTARMPKNGPNNQPHTTDFGAWQRPLNYERPCVCWGSGQFADFCARNNKLHNKSNPVSRGRHYHATNIPFLVPFGRMVVVLFLLFLVVVVVSGMEIVRVRLSGFDVVVVFVAVLIVWVVPCCAHGRRMCRTMCCVFVCVPVDALQFIIIPIVLRYRRVKNFVEFQRRQGWRHSSFPQKKRESARKSCLPSLLDHSREIGGVRTAFPCGSWVPEPHLARFYRR